MQMIKKMVFLFILSMGFVLSLGVSQIAYAENGSSQSSAGKSGKLFVFDPKKLMWYAYDDGQLVGSGRASGGAGYCRDIKRSCRTPSGMYTVKSKGGPDCRSSTYPLPNGGAPMGYCMFFNRGYAIHASNEVRPYNASHGCVRVKPSAAAWLSENFINVGTRVWVKSY